MRTTSCCWVCLLVLLAGCDTSEPDSGIVERIQSFPDTTLYVRSPALIVPLLDYFWHSKGDFIGFQFAVDGAAVVAGFVPPTTLEIAPQEIGSASVMVSAIADESVLDTFLVDVTPFEPGKAYESFPEAGSYEATEILGADSIRFSDRAMVFTTNRPSPPAYWGIQLGDFRVGWYLRWARERTTLPPDTFGVNTHLSPALRMLGPITTLYYHDPDQIPRILTHYKAKEWFIRYKEPAGNVYTGEFWLALEFMQGDARESRQIVGCFAAAGQ